MFIVGCVAIVVLALGTFVMMIRPMDSYLNYSMRKKVKTNKIPLYFPNDRTNESLYGPSLEDPNVGAYLPAFVCSIVTYVLALILLVVLVVVRVALKNDKITDLLAVCSFVAMMMNATVCLILRERYKKKYFLHKDELIAKITAIKEQQKNEKNDD